MGWGESISLSNHSRVGGVNALGGFEIVLFNIYGGGGWILGVNLLKGYNKTWTYNTHTGWI